MRAIVVDIAEFIANPTHSGIQRVIRELVTNWPDDVPVRYVRYDAAVDGLLPVSGRMLQRTVAYSRDDGLTPLEFSRQLRLLESSVDPKPLNLSPDDKVLVPEVFYDGSRIDFYQRSESYGSFRSFFVVFDFIPWFKPDVLRLGSYAPRILMPYLALIQQAQQRCFISGSVRDDFVHRIRRVPGGEPGPVIVLGSNGLKIEKQAYHPDRKDLLSIGVLDGKKNQEFAFSAFRSMVPGDCGTLLFAGHVPAKPAPWLHDLIDYSGDDVHVLGEANHDVIASCLRRSRATVFISTNEGFGLPAVESLYCGVPVIVHAGLPALADAPPLGQIRLPEITVEAVAGAIARVYDDDNASRLWAEAADLTLPTWRDYSAALTAWVGSS